MIEHSLDAHVNGTKCEACAILRPWLRLWLWLVSPKRFYYSERRKRRLLNDFLGEED